MVHYTGIASMVILGGYFVARKLILGAFIGGYGTAEHLSFLNWRSFSGIGRFVMRTLSPALPLEIRPYVHRPAVTYAALVLLAMFVAYLWARRHSLLCHARHTLLLCVAYIMSLVPVLALQVSSFDLRGERFLYLPSVFASILVIQAIWALVAGIRWRTGIALAVVLFELLCVLMTNTKWAYASELTSRLVSFLSEHDPEHTLILNLPDNYRGAAMFGCGLDEACSLFSGRSWTAPYRVLSRHDLHGTELEFVPCIDDSTVYLFLPAGHRFNAMDAQGLHVRFNPSDREICISDPSAQMDGVDLLCFLGPRFNPPFATVQWVRTTDSQSARPRLVAPQVSRK
jgi:hypothetical protein